MNEQEKQLKKAFDALMSQGPNAEEFEKLSGSEHGPEENDRLDKLTKSVRAVIGGESPLKRAFVLCKALGMTIEDIAEVNAAAAAALCMKANEMCCCGAAMGIKKKMGL